MDFLSFFGLMILASNFKTMGMQKGGYEDLFLTVVGSVGSVANGLSRVLWGPLQDKTGFRPLYRIVLVTELILFSTLPSIVQANQYIYLIWVFTCYLCLGAHFVLFPNAIIGIFGLRSSVLLSSFIYTTRACSTLLGMFLSKRLSAKYGTDSYSILFYGSCVLIVTSLVLLVALFDETPIRKSTTSMDDSFVSAEDEGGLKLINEDERSEGAEVKKKLIEMSTEKSTL